MKRKLCFLTILVTLFSFNSLFSQQWNPQHPGWTDSFAANGFCWCNSSNFDHGIGTKTVTINGTNYKIIDICDELKKHPQYRAFQNGDAPYNDIQCGNGPANDAADETGCPGRTDLGPSGCNQIGPKWDMNWLQTRPRFGGGGNGGGNNNGPETSFNSPSNNSSLQAPATIKVDVKATDNDGVSNVKLYINNSFIRQENVNPYLWNNNNQDTKLQNLGVGTYTLKAEATDKKGKTTTESITIQVINDGGGNNAGSVTFLGQSINKYISSENGSRSMRANRTQIGSGENFTLESANNGTISIKGNNGKYVSSENGKKAMNCNRNAVGAWEKFTLEPLGGDLYAIKGNNGKYVSHENGRDMGIFCNRNAIGSWEKFIIKGLDISIMSNEENNTVLNTQSISVYPNPMIIGDDISVQISISHDVHSSVEIMDLNGRSIVKRNLGILKAGTRSISLNNLRNSIKANGLYLVRVTLGKSTIVKQIMIE